MRRVKPENETVILDYLETTVPESGPLYVKARNVQSEIDVPAPEIGSLIAELGRTSDKYRIERWTSAQNAVWRIERYGLREENKGSAGC